MESLDRKVTKKFMILRFDGDGFSKFTQKNFEKPFDVKFHELMKASVDALLVHNFPEVGIFGSDEISLVFKNERFPFDGRVEKCLSELPSLIASTFTNGFGSPVVFDAKIFETDSANDVIEYMKERSDSLRRNAVNDAFYWKMVKDGHGKGSTSKQMMGMKNSEKIERLDASGYKLPEWYRVFFWAENVTVKGLNPLSGMTVDAIRRKWTFSPHFPLDLLNTMKLCTKQGVESIYVWESEESPLGKYGEGKTKDEAIDSLFRRLEGKEEWSSAMPRI